jgi:hypothetical protein
MMVEGTHYSHDCNCKSCKQVVRNMPETKNIIERFEEEFGWLEEAKETRTVKNDIKQFILSELRALKKEVIGSLDFRNDNREHALKVFERFGIK